MCGPSAYGNRSSFSVSGLREGERRGTGGEEAAGLGIGVNTDLSRVKVNPNRRVTQEDVQDTGGEGGAEDTGAEGEAYQAVTVSSARLAAT